MMCIKMENGKQAEHMNSSFQPCCFLPAMTCKNFVCLKSALRSCLKIDPLNTGIHGSFTKDYLGPSKAWEEHAYDIRNGVGIASAPKYS